MPWLLLPLRRTRWAWSFLWVFGAVTVIAAPQKSELKEWKSRFGTTYYAHPGLPPDYRPKLRPYPTLVPISPMDERILLVGINEPHSSFDLGPMLEFKSEPSKTVVYLYASELKTILKSGDVLDHLPGSTDPKPESVKLVEKEAEDQRTVWRYLITFAAAAVLGVGVLVFLISRLGRRSAKNAGPAKPAPHPALRSWLCASCGWLGFVGREGNPYDVGVGIGTAAAGAGAAGVVAGGAGLAGGVVILLVGVAVFLIGIPLILLFGIGLLVMALGVVIMAVGGVMSLVGGTAAGAGATIAASGAAAGAGSYAKGQAHAQRALPCPVCKQALIPCASPMGKQFLTTHPEVLTPLRPAILGWLEFVRDYEGKTGAVIPREPWPGAAGIPALAMDEPAAIEVQEADPPADSRGRQASPQEV